MQAMEAKATRKEALEHERTSSDWKSNVPGGRGRRKKEG